MKRTVLPALQTREISCERSDLSQISIPGATGRQVPNLYSHTPCLSSPLLLVHPRQPPRLPDPLQVS